MEFKTRIFYHITESSNLESILKYGLNPQFGPRTLKCDKEPLVYMTTEECLSSWYKTLITAKHPITNPIILKIDCTQLKIIYRKKYINGIEIASRTNIKPDKISIYERR